MKVLLAILIVLLVIILVIAIFVVTLKNKVKNFLNKYFNTNDLKKAIEVSEIEYQNTPKSLSGMEAIALPLIEKDFPNLNINELKGMVDASIINYFEMLESKEYKDINNASESVKEYIKSQINDLKSDDSIKYVSLKIHKTIIHKYEKKNGLAVISFQTALEYLYKKNNDSLKKIQDRFYTEYIYIIDSKKADSKIKAIGLNCPNCGAPINSLGNKICSYCGSGVVDLVKYTWLLNQIKKI